ncbi:MAG: DUF4198 domain-containing protein [Steroidobacteraceae bacterium]
MKNRKLLWSCLAVTLAITSANAHGIWFAQRSGEMAFIYGEGAEDDATVTHLDKIRGIAAYDASGTAVATRLMPSDHLLLVDLQAKPAVLTGVMDNGFYSEGANGKWLPKGKSQVPGARQSGHYMKYSVRLLTDTQAPLAALPDQVLQITPVTAALPTRKGDTLKLRALYKGQPRAGVQVLADFVNDPEAKPVLTDKNGLVTLKIRNQGLNVIFASYEVPAINEDADIVQHAATLSFVTPSAAE